MNKPIFKKEILNSIRIISVLCIILLTIVEIQIIQKIFVIIYNKSDLYFSILATSIENFFVIIIGILLIIYPHKIEFLAIATFIYSIHGIVFEVNNPMGISMYYLAMVSLLFRGFFNKNGRKKMIIAVLLLLSLIILRFHFGINIFINTIIDYLAYSLVLGIMLYLIIHFYQAKQYSIIEKKLNLAEYSGLVKSDVILLQKVLNNKQYKEISTEINRTEGTVRNRLNKIYDILGIMDKIGFITIYTGYEIIFNED